MLYRSGIETSEDTGGRVVRFAVPVYDDLDEFRGLVVIDYDFERITNLITTGRANDTGWVGLISPGGKILSHPQTKLIGTAINMEAFSAPMK